MARRQLPYECARCGVDGDDVKLELDHIINDAQRRRRSSDGDGDGDYTATLDDVQWLCMSCHKRKTQREARHGRALVNQRRTGKRPPRLHPSDVL